MYVNHNQKFSKSKLYTNYSILDVPNMFQLNYRPPPFSYKGEAASALVLGTGLATGGLTMMIFGGCWIADISTFPEFSLKLKRLMGQEPDSSQLPMDAETAQVVNQLEEILNNDKKWRRLIQELELYIFYPYGQ